MRSRRQILKRILFGGGIMLTAKSSLASILQNSITDQYAPILQNDDRAYWVKLLYKIAYPVVSNLSRGTLKKNMRVEKSPTYGNRPINFTYLEAVGRTYVGIAPWLALPDDDSEEGKLRKELRNLAVQGLENAVNPDSADYLDFRNDFQPIVDSAFLAQAFLRAPDALWRPLSALTKNRIVTEFKSLRDRKPSNNNWLLFGAITEAFLLSIGEDYDLQRITQAFTKFKEWYLGDGWYSDGPKFAFDYYNSFVIHSMLVDSLKIMSEKGFVDIEEYKVALKRLQRYAEHQELLISPEGTFPPIGRSIIYRTGALQSLAEVALMEKLPDGIKPAQVRTALTAVMKNMFTFEDNFDSEGWLQLGFCGYQPDAADYYISTGSLYLATVGFLPLGLPATNPFWIDPPANWTAKQAWLGKKFKKHTSFKD